LGSQVAGIRASHSQGGTQTSNNPLDVAIQGRGFIVLSDQGSRYFTRAGNLHLDAQGNLVAENGFAVQGYQRNPVTGAIDQSLGLQNITIPTGLMAPVPTTQFEIGMNLDANKPTGTNFAATVQIIDSQGSTHMATLSLTKDISTAVPPVTRWRFDITIPNNEIAGVSPTDTQRFSLLTGAVATATPGAGALVFDDTGTLVSAYLGPDPTTNPPLANLTVPPSSLTLPALANGANLSPITWNLLDSSNLPTITGVAAASAMSGINQNGIAPGAMSSLSVLSDGRIAAVFSNGSTLDVAQLALAQFSNPEGLTAQGGGLYTENRESGASRIGAPGDGGLGTVMGGALEQSNVDLATELTRIITFQRGYQANARIITATDQILQETMNLMR
jgi:flagellar hook protein FlgE